MFFLLPTSLGQGDAAILQPATWCTPFLRQASIELLLLEDGEPHVGGSGRRLAGGERHVHHLTVVLAVGIFREELVRGSRELAASIGRAGDRDERVDKYLGGVLGDDFG